MIFCSFLHVSFKFMQIKNKNYLNQTVLYNTLKINKDGLLSNSSIFIANSVFSLSCSNHSRSNISLYCPVSALNPLKHIVLHYKII